MHGRSHGTPTWHADCHLATIDRDSAENGLLLVGRGRPRLPARGQALRLCLHERWRANRAKTGALQVPLLQRPGYGTTHAYPS